MEPPPPSSLFSGSTRKQNVACDACRAKKIRCQRVTITQRCGQCAAKDLECTSNYIEQLQNKPRRPRRFKSNEDREKEKEKEARKSDDEGRVSPPTASGSGTGTGASRRGSAEASASASASRDPGPNGSASASNSTVNMNPNGSDAPSSEKRSEPMAVDDPLAVFALIQPPNNMPFKRDAAALQRDLLRYLFCPVPVLHQEWRYSDVWGMEQTRAGACDVWEEAGGYIWEETPSAAHLGFWAGAESELDNVAVELIDTFFTIVDPRIPILDAHQFLARFQAPTTHPIGPLPHALLAVVLAFGARFIDHPVFRADREECTARDTDSGGRPRSRLVQLLVVRAREVTEMNKACRTSTLANAQAMLLMEGLLCQSSVLSTRYRAYNLSSASRHLESLPYAPMMQVSSEKDEKTRTQLALYIMSGTEAALFRLKPETWEGNAEIAAFFGSSYEDTIQLGLNQDDDLWLLAARTGTGIIKRLCAELWHPKVRASGVPLPLLRDFVHDHSSWRDLYLGKLGMPASFPSPDQDFTATMKAATTDILFHGMWLVVERAVRDFGIHEGDDTARHMFAFEVQQMKDRLSQEAVHSAMRITMLAALAAEQGLLRLDPLILYRPIYDAGMFLARRGQDESLGCVAGLKQYAVAYPQMWDLATEIEATLSKTQVAALPPAFINGNVTGML